MIYDSLTNIEKYKNLFIHFSDILLFLRNSELASIEPQRFEISKGIFANINDYYTKPEENINWEVHYKYLDIQYVIQGEENIGYTLNNNLECIEPYTEEKDIALYKGKGHLYLPLKDDYFIILFPGEFHKPGIMFESTKKVKKLVIKVLWG